MKKLILIASLLLSPLAFSAENPRIESSRSNSRQVNADWNATSGPALILNKPTITSPVNADWNATSGPAMILNKPTFSNSPQINADWNATSGVSMILNKPVIPAAQVNADWNATTGVAQILNKPTIVNADWNATSGPAQILNKPSSIGSQINADWNAVSGAAQILNKPIIPAAQVNADWNASTGVAQIANKPATLPTILKINTVTADYVLKASDLGGTIVFNPPAGSRVNLVIPQEFLGSEILPIGAEISGINTSESSYVTVLPSTGVTLTNPDNAFRTRARGSKFTLTKYGLNIWGLDGDLFSLEMVAYIGDVVTLKAVIDRAATPPFTFTWAKNGTTITGATIASLYIPDVVSGDAGSYTVTVTNSSGTRSSETFTLVVK
jgi:hypothetical protein